MITNNMGTVIVGSANLQTSVANAEIISSDTRVINLSIINNSDCHMIINGSNSIFIRANQGLLIDVCHSLKIVEAGIVFNWTGQKA